MGDKPLRVLHVTQAVGEGNQTAGGVPVVMLDLARQLVQQDVDVWVAAPSRGGLPEGVTAMGAGFRQWEATRSPGPASLAEARRLSQILHSLSPDVVHLHSSKAGLAGRLAIRGRTPTIFSPHAWSFLHGEAGLVGYASERWERIAARWTDVFMCVSQDEERVGREHGIRGRYVVITNSSDLPASRASMREAREQVLPDIPESAPVALCIGRLTVQKGQDVLVAAWNNVARAVPNARLVIVGTGPTEARIRAEAGPDVVLVPSVPRDQVPLWNLAADVVAFPSRWEGLSLGVLEALQLGRPVIVTDCEGMREAMEGGRGSVVPVGDRVRLAEELIRYLSQREWAAEQGALAARAYDQVHGRRRRQNIAKYAALVRGLAARAQAPR